MKGADEEKRLLIKLWSRSRRKLFSIPRECRAVTSFIEGPRTSLSDGDMFALGGSDSDLED